MLFRSSTAATAVTVSSATTLTATTPAQSAGPVDVTITTAGGTSTSSSSDLFTYDPVPAVTAIAPTEGPVAGGTEVTVTGTGFVAGATTLDFGVLATPAMCLTTTSCTATAPQEAPGNTQVDGTSFSGSAVTSPVDVTVITPGGASVTSAADVFTYYQGPTVTSVSPSDGSPDGGNEVTVSGTGFSESAVVNVGNVAATDIHVNSTSSITATVPAAAVGTVDVTVTTEWGTSGTSPADTYTYDGAPTITDVQPQAGPESGGTVVTVLGSGFTSATVVMFGTVEATSLSVVSPTTLMATSPPGQGTVSITITTAGGSDPSPTDLFTYDIRPSIVSVSPSSGVMTGGMPITITGAGFTSDTTVRFGSSAATSVTVMSPTVVVATAPAGLVGRVEISVTTPGGTSSSCAADGFTYTAPSQSEAKGYWMAASDGGVFAFGDAGFYGSLGGIKLDKPINGMISTGDGKGYWMVASDGGVFAFGDAGFYGSLGGIRLTSPIVGMALTPDGKGYWMVASDGGVFAFGDAGFYGSLGGTRPEAPITSLAATPDGRGYWIVGADGGVFAFGDAGFYGSLGGIKLTKPINGMASTADGKGYWMVASDGGVFAFGDATYHGSTGGIRLVKPIVGMGITPGGDGYWLVASDGGIFAFGDAGFYGSMGGRHLNQPVVAMAYPF